MRMTEVLSRLRKEGIQGPTTTLLLQLDVVHGDNPAGYVETMEVLKIDSDNTIEWRALEVGLVIDTGRASPSYSANCHVKKVSFRRSLVKASALNFFCEYRYNTEF
jgi:hypothetical protein